MQMQMEEESLRNRVALGWVMMLLSVVVMFLFMTIESLLMDNNLMSLRLDPGSSLRWLTYYVAFYALMPVYVHLAHGLKARLFRWLAVAAAAAGFLFLLLHHLSHWQAGQRPNFTSHVLDLTMHVIGLWLTVNSVRWAKSTPAAAA